MGDVKKTLTLGAVLRRIGNFDISSFEGRLVLQKTVYLLQAHGLYFGYKFSWYVHGPYCPELTRDGFKLEPIYNHIPSIKFANPNAEKKLGNFLEFLATRKNDADWLEQLACTHFLKALNPDATKRQIIEAVLNHESHFTESQCLQAWEYLSNYALI